MWEPRCLTTLLASMACYRDRFTSSSIRDKTDCVLFLIIKTWILAYHKTLSHALLTTHPPIGHSFFTQNLQILEPRAILILHYKRTSFFTLSCILSRVHTSCKCVNPASVSTMFIEKSEYIELCSHPCLLFPVYISTAHTLQTETSS
jgi:hypothetical protein